MSKIKVLVTGATGFLGGHLVKALCEKNYNVSVLIRKSSDTSKIDSFPLQKIYGDITNTQALLEATQEQDLVFHLAGMIAYKKSQRAAMEKINVAGTRNVVDACITNHVKKLLFLSSVVAIGASFDGQPLNEEASFNLSPYNLGYFETKRQAEKIVVEAYQEHQLPVYLINPSTIYGAGDATKGSRKTQIKVAKGDFKFYTPGGVNIVAVKDVIDCIFKVLEVGQPARRYIIAGENITIKRLFELIAKEAGVPPPKIAIPRMGLKILGYVGDFMTAFGKETSLSSETAVTSTLYHWFDSTRAQRELGYSPTPAQEAISESIGWMKEKGLLS